MEAAVVLTGGQLSAPASTPVQWHLNGRAAALSAVSSRRRAYDAHPTIMRCNRLSAEVLFHVKPHRLESLGAGSREPGAGSREPGAGSREPGAGSREPGAGSREPAAG